MGTRGLYGFRMNGVEKFTYNHYDSYPEGLGAEVANFCESTSVAEMKEMFSRIVMVDESAKPTPEQIMEYAQYCDPTVGRRTAEDWYCLLRNLQGELCKLKEIPGAIYMIDNHDFIKDSLFCEYAYIIDLDNETLEYWIGFQRKPWQDNPYGTEAEDGYYPCKRYAEFDLGMDAEQVVKEMTGIDPNKDPDEEERDIAAEVYSAAEELGWSVYFEADYIRFSNGSPAGEDLELEFDWSQDLDSLIQDLEDYTDGFDVDDHVYMWLEAKRNGHCTPSALRLAEDAEAIQSMLEDLTAAIAALKQ